MTKELIKDICRELNIKCTSFSQDWGLLLEKDNQNHFVMGNKFDLNNHASGLIIDDKYALYDLLSKKNVPVIKHQLLYHFDNQNTYAIGKNSYEYVIDFFNANHQDIVVKPNEGSCGNGVNHVTDEKTLQTTIEKLFLKNYSISICPFYNIKTEYRVIMLNGICECIYGKKKPVVYGNSEKTIEELLKEFNPSFFNKPNSFFNKSIDIKYIPKSGEEVEYNWQFNLSKGSQVFLNIPEEQKIKIIELAKRAYDACNLNFCTIDVIETTNDEFYIIEINSGVTINKFTELVDNGYEIAREIYKKAIISMFNSKM